MPNRIIKESIRTSKTINAMSDFQFRLWVYLITYVDDYGRGSADPELLKGFVFPRRKGITESTIDKALLDLANSGSILLYEVDGESYFCFPNWADHQRIQTKRSKFPSPSDGNIKKSTVSHGESPPESNPIQIQNPNPNPNPTARTRAEVEGDFEKFWNAYPKKVNKKKAFEAFKKISVPVEILLEALEEQKKSLQWMKDNGQYIPHPTTWLNGERWVDVVTDTAPVTEGRQLDEDEIAAIRRMMESDEQLPQSL